MAMGLLHRTCNQIPRRCSTSVRHSWAARQVFAAAVGAWVFGGIGSWSDLFVEDENHKERYDEVSESMFRSAGRVRGSPPVQPGTESWGI